MAQRLCALAELPEESARGFEVARDGTTHDIFLVRHQGVVHAYRNRCPHTGVTLNWLPDQFLDNEGAMIQCAVHGALFRIADGLCLHGPCVNQALRPLHVELREDELWVSL